MVFVQLLNHKVQLLFSFPCCSLWKEVTTRCPRERTWDWCSRSLRVSTQIFQNPFAWKICPFSPIYLLQLIIYITRIHSLLPLIITQCHFTSCVAQTDVIWPLGVLSVGPHVPLTYLYHWGWVCCLFWSTSLLSGNTRCAPDSLYIFPAPVLKSAISPRIPTSFYQRMEKQDLSTRGIIATGLLLLPTFSSDRARKYVYVC